jgi:hypothetical protein
LPVVRRQQRAPWVWALLGHAHEQDDPDKAIVCYFRAIQLAGQPQDVANTRIALARLLAVRERFEETALQVRRALDYRTAGNYRIPQPLSQMAETDWYRTLASPKDIPAEPDVANEADVILFGGESAQTDYRIGVIDNQNRDKALAHVAFSFDEGLVLLYRRLRGIDKVQVGDIIEVGFISGDPQPARWRSSAATHIEGFAGRMTGEVTQPDGQVFGFLMTSDGQRVFIHPTLMERLVGNETSKQTCIAVMGKDKKGRQGWRALRWIDERGGLA